MVMERIEKGYQELPYGDFIDLLRERYKIAGKTPMDLANEIGITPQSVHNAMNPERQVLKDKILSQFITALNLDGEIVWKGGTKKYYIKKDL